MLDKYLDAVKEVNAATTKADELRASVSEARNELTVVKYGVDIALAVLKRLFHHQYEVEAQRFRDNCNDLTVINDETVSYANSMLSKYGIGVNCDCILKDGDYSGTVKIFDISIANFFK